MSVTRENVEKVLDEKVRPMLEADGGNVELVDVKGDKVYVKLIGACGCCPHAAMTLKSGVERVLKSEIPEIKEVIPADHGCC